MRLIRTVGTLLLLTLMATAAFAQSEIKMGLSAEPSSFDPAVNAGTSQRTIKLLVYRGLVNYAGPEGKITPELAKDWTISSDHLTYTFHLRDATFHDGSPVTAADVKFTLDRILDKQTGATFAKQMSVIDSVTVVDPKTVEIKLKRPDTPFLDYLAVPESVIVSKAWVEAHPKDWTHPLGDGPYVFKSYVPGQNIVLEKYANYYQPGIPKTDKLVFEFYADSSLRTAALQNGDVDIVEYVPWNEIPQLKANPNIQVLGGKGPFMGLIFNTNFKPFSDPRVRRAVGYAIQRKVVIDTAFSGQGTPIWGLPIPQTSLAYDASLDNYFSYDPAKAKQLLAEAGYPNGFTATLLSTSQYDFHKNTAIAVQAELAKVGITVKLDLPDWATRLQKNLKAQFDFLVVGTAGDISDPDYLSDYFQGGQQGLNNAPGFNDPEINKLLEEGRTTLDPQKRHDIYVQLEKRALELSPLDFLMWRDQSYAATSKLKGFSPLPGFLNFQSGIRLQNAYLAQ